MSNNQIASQLANNHSIKDMNMMAILFFFFFVIIIILCSRQELCTYVYLYLVTRTCDKLTKFIMYNCKQWSNTGKTIWLVTTFQLVICASYPFDVWMTLIVCLNFFLKGTMKVLLLLLFSSLNSKHKITFMSCILCCYVVHIT